MHRELAEELSVGLDADLSQLPVTNRFIYSVEHKVKRNLDHDGQDAVMFACRIEKSTPLKLQVEEVADARWFAANDVSAALTGETQRDILDACLSEIAKQA